MAWAEEVEDEVMRPVLERVGRRVAMGAPLESCLQPLEEAVGPDGRALHMALEVHAFHGGAVGPVLEGLAAGLEIRATMTHERAAASAISRLSGRLMILLGGGFVVLLPAWGEGPAGPLVAGLLTAVALMTVGVRWMKRLTPRPVPSDPVAGLADVIASLISGGLGLGPAIGIATEAMHGTGIDNDLARATRRVGLGASWAQSLALAGSSELRALGRAVAQGQRLGAPLEAALGAFARELRVRHKREFELRARRAAVMLVLPLVLCLLPAFAILIVVPLLRSLTA